MPRSRIALLLAVALLPLADFFARQGMGAARDLFLRRRDALALDRSGRPPA
jgi:hypothetical protein